MDIKETQILGDQIDTHWYYRSKSRALGALLARAAPRALLDVGSGSGYFARFLLRETAAGSATCVDINYDADSDALERDKPIRFRRAIGARSDADLVLLLDVLEHVDDDVGLLRECVDAVPSGAVFAISVPAFKLIWSSHDLFLGHKRRYTLGQLEAVVRRAGLTVERGRYYFAAILPLVLVLRMVQRVFAARRPPASDLRRHWRWTNATLTAVCHAELPLLKWNRLFGVTAFCIARKP